MSVSIRPIHRHVFLLWFPVLALVLIPQVAQPQPLTSQGQTAQIQQAISTLESLYQQEIASPEQEQSFFTVRAQALDVLAQGGPLSRLPLRQALQEEHLPEPLAYDLGSVLALVEGRGAGEFLAHTLGTRSPGKAPSEAFYFLHTFGRVDAAHAAPLVRSLAALPAETRFPFPAEDLAFPLVGGVAFLYASMGSEGLNALAHEISAVGKLPPPRAEVLLRATAQLQLVRLVPNLLQQAEKLPAKDPNLRVLVWALGQLDDLEAVPFLAGTAGKHKDPNIREEAVFALGEMRSPRCEKALRAALADGAPTVRSYAITALALLETPGAKDALKAALGGKETSERVQRDYLEAAQRLGDSSWISALDQAEMNWPKLVTRAKEVRLKVRSREPLPEDAPPPLLWPSQPLNTLSAGELSKELMKLLDAGGLGFSDLKKTTLYSAGPQHIGILETFRTALAERLTRRSVDNWLDALQTLKLVRRRMRDDPRPMFARKEPPRAAPAGAGPNK